MSKRQTTELQETSLTFSIYTHRMAQQLQWTKPLSIMLETARKKLVQLWDKNKTGDTKLSKIKDIGEIETYRSFCDFNKKRNMFKVYTTESYLVPEISDYLFFEHNFYTAEHDIPYQQRALTDLAASKNVWLFDTQGEKKKLKVLIYDIEITQYEEGKKDLHLIV